MRVTDLPKAIQTMRAVKVPDIYRSNNRTWVQNFAASKTKNRIISISELYNYQTNQTCNFLQLLLELSSSYALHYIFMLYTLFCYTKCYTKQSAFLDFNKLLFQVSSMFPGLTHSETT